MRSKLTTFLLIGLMCFSSVSGFLTVICHGSDGHIAVEPVAHEHCQCSETDNSDDHGSLVEIAMRSATDHDHCTDTLATSSFVIPQRKEAKLASQKVAATNLIERLNPTQTTSFSGYQASQSPESGTFYAPIRTIVLLT